MPLSSAMSVIARMEEIDKMWEHIRNRIATEIAGHTFEGKHMRNIKKRISKKQFNRGMSARSMMMPRPTAILGNFYEPVALSIGPSHRHLENIKNMEAMKSDILDGHGTSENNKDYLIQYCCFLVAQCAQDLRKWYEDESEIPYDMFCEIMLFDCIFLIMLIYGDSRKDYLPSRNNSVNAAHLKTTVGFERVGWTPIMFMEGPVFTDILLVENQIPFFLIRKLWQPALLLLGVDIHEITGFGPVGDVFDDDADTRLVQQHFVETLKNTRLVQQHTDRIDVGSEAERARHLLDFYYGCKVPFPYDERKCEITTSVFPSATQLYESGIRFKANESSSNMFHISFKKGVLEIPTLVLDSQLKYILSNLLSWERSTPSSRTKAYVFSYVLFMDSLINTGKDVALLQKLGILNNKLSSDNDAATFFNNFGETWGIIFGNNWTKNLYAPMMKDIRKYGASSRRRHCTSLKHNYFSSPWTGISLIAGVFLLSLAVVQTVWTVLPYYYRR